MITIIAGMPCTGKTYLMNTIRSKLNNVEVLKDGLVNYEMYRKEDIIILGKYDGSKFEGTDRLSLSVQPEAIQFVIKHRNSKILIEGDRLFTQSFITKLSEKKIKIRLIYLDTSFDYLIKRFRARGQIQNDKFLKGRFTKMVNIARIIKPERVDTTKSLEKVVESIISPS